MTIAIIGRKAGMTRVFTDAGEAVPVTVIECTPNRVTQVKTVEVDGYRAVQVAVGEKKASRVNKPLTGHYKKAGVAAGRGLWEIRLDDGEGKDLQAGSEIKVEVFNEIKAVDVTGTSIGKGFAGVIKRHNFGGGRATHGNSLSHRVPGSIGQRQSPGKVWKKKKMAGHMGNERVTVLNLDLVKVDVERNLLLIKGAVPGAANGDVIVRPTVK
ncbi:MAG TPA: 50S ribosomal protein L3 [Stenotrophobium sp.]|nr:50S ribosomal protein L3 [Stenotrophobium sp.]